MRVERASEYIVDQTNYNNKSEKYNKIFAHMCWQ